MGARGPGAKPAKRRDTAPATASAPSLGGLTRAGRVIAFCEGLTVTSGAHAGRALVLRPWQRDLLARVYAEGADGRRAVRTALVSTARKSGKSTLCAALALCHLVGPEAVPRGQVVSAAADRGQASIIYNELRAFALAVPAIADRLLFRDFNKTVEDVETGSVFAALSADHRKAHGLSPTVAICDEVAQWRGRELLDALVTGQGAHAEPLLFAISTRSPDPDNPLEELIRYAGQVAEGTIEDPSFAATVFSAPADADPWAEATWRLANPDMDAVRLADIRTQALRAKRLPSLEPAFRAYVLNMPVAPDDRFIGPAEWDACGAEAEARGPCFAALDLASGAADLTAFALFWPETGALRVRGFLPSGQVERKQAEDRAPYRDWIGRGLIVPIPGMAIDRAWLAGWLAAECDGLDLQAVAHDRWGLADLQAVLDREGVYLPLRPHGQGYKDMSPSIASFEALVLSGGLRHGGNALLRWAVANAAVDMDPAGSRKLSKARSRGRIDPLIAAVMAVGFAGREPPAPSFEGGGLAGGLGNPHPDHAPGRRGGAPRRGRGDPVARRLRARPRRGAAVRRARQEARLQDQRLRRRPRRASSSAGVVQARVWRLLYASGAFRIGGDD
jgi:phage terminase large subunit-like protein